MKAPRWLDPTDMLSRREPGRAVALTPALDHTMLVNRALELAGGLAAQRIRRAALWFEDAAEFAIALYACWRADVTACTPVEILPSVCEQIDADVDLWLTDTALPIPANRQRVPASWIGSRPLPTAALDPEIGGMVLYTSGSSGPPKAVAKSWRQLVAETRALARHWPARQALVVLGSVGTNHMFGLPFRVLWPLSAGHLLDRPQRAYPEELHQASLPHERVIWITTPALLRRVEQRIDWSVLHGRMAAIYVAGSPLPPALSHDIETACGCRPTEIYGSTETGVIATRAGSEAWQFLNGVHAGLNDEGALWVDSPWTAHGREQTADAAAILPQGLRLQGRIDRIVKLEEKRIGLPAIEAVLAEHAFVAEAHVGQKAGAARLTALIVPSEAGLNALRNGGRRAVTDALRQHVMGRIPTVGVPRFWRLLRHLPWNAQGKLPRPCFERLAGPREHMPAFQPCDARSESDWRATFEVPLDLACFAGHFPIAPVVPGIAQLDWALRMCQKYVKPDLRAGAVENLKFQRLMRPGDPASLTLRWDAARASLAFAFHIAGQPSASGRILHTHERDPA